MANYEEKKKQREKERARAQKKQKRKGKSEGASYWMLAPLIAILTVIPLIVTGHVFNTKLGGVSWYVAETTKTDYFYYGKMFALICVSIYMMIAFAVYLIKGAGKIVWSKQLSFLAAYAVLSIVSAVLSENSYFSFTGMWEHFEPLWALLGYCLIVYYAYVTLKCKEQIQRIMCCLLVGVTFMLLIGVLQSIGHDPLQIDWVLNLILPDGVQKAEQDVMLRNVILTLGNTNYTGVYLVMILPVLFGMFWTATKLGWKIVSAGLFVVGAYVLYMSHSTAGLLVSVVIILFLLLLFARDIKLFGKINKIGMVLIAGLAIAIMSFVLVKGGHIDKIRTGMQENSYALKSIETKKECVRITYNDASVDFYNVLGDSGYLEIEVTDDKGQKVESVCDENTGRFYIQDERFPFEYYAIGTDEFQGFVVNIEGNLWTFSNLMKEGDSTYYAYENGKCITLKKDTKTYNTFLDKHQEFATGRGYIWSRTLPLLKKHIFIGSGPDTFFLEYPNDDFVAKANVGYRYTYISKPHSMYLQMGVQTGVLSVICLLVFVGWYIVDSVKTYRKMQEKNYLSKMGTCIMTSVIGYLLMGVTNDSMICISPIFYVLLGIGMAINKIIKSEKVS